MTLLLKWGPSIILAAIVGLFSQYVLKSWQWLNIIPWALICFIIGTINRSRKEAILKAAIFGYVTSSSYLFYDYAGKTDITSILRLISVVLSVSLAGMGGGILCSALGNLFGRKFKR